MITGYIYGTTSNEYIQCRIYWSAKADELNNKSTVSARLEYKRTNTGYSTYGNGEFTLSIGGTQVAHVENRYTEIYSDWVSVLEGSKTVTHNDSGAMSVTIFGAGSIPGTSLESSSCSDTVSLETIPRATTIDSLSCSTNYFTGTLTYKFTPKSTNWYNRCNIAVNIGGAYAAVKSIDLGRLGTKQATRTVTFTESELSTIYNKFPSAEKGTLRFTFRTYSDSGYSNQVGSAGYKEITLYIPNTSATQPTATMTLSPVSSLASPFDTLYIKGRTKVDANFTNGAGKYGATIKSYKMSVGTKTYGDPWTSEYITTDGKVTVTGTVTDSRGFARTYTQDVTFIPYASPRILPASGESEIICARCDKNGNLSDSGTYLRIRAKRDYKKVVSGGAQKNFCSIRYRYKPDGGSWSSWDTILADGASSDEIDTGALLEGTLDVTKSYSVRVGVVDTMGESEYTSVIVPTDKVYMHRAGSINALAIGKYAETPNTFDVAQDMTAIFRGDVQFKGEAWISRALGTNVSESTVTSGRWGGTGVYYRVCAGGKHVYVAFNVSFKTSSSTVRAESETIPSEYRPTYDVYALCPVGFTDGTRGIATASVSPNGRVNIYAVHKLPGATLSTGDTVSWIDGYIDYWT
jgi:hypothetical protein